MRDLDRRAIETFNVPAEELMERAGAGLAHVVAGLARFVAPGGAAVHGFAGRGNNGGDVFVAARYLQEQGYSCAVWLACAASELQGEAHRQFSRMKEAGVPFREMLRSDDWEQAGIDGPCDVVIDGLLGTGARGPARGPIASAIQFINTLGPGRAVVAVDIPSGLNGDLGSAEGDVVQADVTVTMGLPKTGLLKAAALDYVGNLEVIDLGFPPDLIADVPSTGDFLAVTDVRKALPRRAASAHKGVFGHVLAICGSERYAGAALLTTRAASRSGAGLVSALVPAGVATSLNVRNPEVMCVTSAATGSGELSRDAAADLDLAEFDALVIGPGLGRGDGLRDLLAHCLAHARGPICVDADALNAVAGDVAFFKTSTVPVVLTPHPGELARLLDTTTEAVQADREGHARRAAELSGARVVLKGAGTLIASPEGALCINMTGNPGMASGGMGDVLAGLIAGLLAQGLDADAAARVGVYLHGRAGDNVAWRTSQPGMLAGDVVEELAYTMREVSPR